MATISFTDKVYKFIDNFSMSGMDNTKYFSGTLEGNKINITDIKYKDDYENKLYSDESAKEYSLFVPHAYWMDNTTTVDYDDIFFIHDYPTKNINDYLDNGMYFANATFDKDGYVNDNLYYNGVRYDYLNVYLEHTADGYAYSGVVRNSDSVSFTYRENPNVYESLLAATLHRWPTFYRETHTGWQKGDYFDVYFMLQDEYSRVTEDWKTIQNLDDISYLRHFLRDSRFNDIQLDKNYRLKMLGPLFGYVNKSSGKRNSHNYYWLPLCIEYDSSTHACKFTDDDSRITFSINGRDITIDNSNINDFVTDKPWEDAYPDDPKPPVYVNVSGSWRKSSAVYIKCGGWGVWTPAKEIYVKDGGIWKKANATHI